MECISTVHAACHPIHARVAHLGLPGVRAGARERTHALLPEPQDEGAVVGDNVALSVSVGFSEQERGLAKPVESFPPAGGDVGRPGSGITSSGQTKGGADDRHVVANFGVLGAPLQPVQRHGQPKAGRRSSPRHGSSGGWFFRDTTGGGAVGQSRPVHGLEKVALDVREGLARHSVHSVTKERSVGQGLGGRGGMGDGFGRAGGGDSAPVGSEIG
mmetsp:Transcript_61521/g.127104  ORF Transcript_61521/g.127104 Transcript_61521/m.127104 type:complete len:215 (-) Transcript_61521:892-1536(-)